MIKVIGSYIYLSCEIRAVMSAFQTHRHTAAARRCRMWTFSESGTLITVEFLIQILYIKKLFLWHCPLFYIISLFVEKFFATTIFFMVFSTHSVFFFILYGPYPFHLWFDRHYQIWYFCTLWFVTRGPI